MLWSISSIMYVDGSEFSHLPSHKEMYARAVWKCIGVCKWPGADVGAYAEVQGQIRKKGYTVRAKLNFSFSKLISVNSWHTALTCLASCVPRAPCQHSRSVEKCGRCMRSKRVECAAGQSQIGSIWSSIYWAVVNFNSNFSKVDLTYVHSAGPWHASRPACRGHFVIASAL